MRTYRLSEGNIGRKPGSPTPSKSPPETRPSHQPRRPENYNLGDNDIIKTQKFTKDYSIFISNGLTDSVNFDSAKHTFPLFPSITFFSQQLGRDRLLEILSKNNSAPLKGFLGDFVEFGHIERNNEFTKNN